MRFQKCLSEYCEILVKFRREIYFPKQLTFDGEGPGVARGVSLDVGGGAGVLPGGGPRHALQHSV